MGLSSKTRIRVRYSETDQMGIVYHANYLVWFEVGRTELFRELGLPYTILEEQGLGLTVIEAGCRYRKPAHYDDELIIITEINRLSSRAARFSYYVYREETLLAEGKTMHIFVNSGGIHTNARRYPIWSRIQEIMGLLNK